MKPIVILILASAFCLGSCKGKNKPNSFEGIVTYKATVLTNTDNPDYNSYQKQKYGDLVKHSIAKNGSFKREYPHSGARGFDFFIYNALTNKAFVKWRNIDTIFATSCAENSLTFISEGTLPAENVIGQLCEGYFIKGIDLKGKQPVSLSYFFPKNKEYINPSLYKRFKEFFYNKVIEKMQAPFYKLIMDMGRYSVTFEVEQIKPGEISTDVVHLPHDFPVKEM
jgi:hypothetical protein